MLHSIRNVKLVKCDFSQCLLPLFVSCFYSVKFSILDSMEYPNTFQFANHSWDRSLFIAWGGGGGGGVRRIFVPTPYHSPDPPITCIAF